MAARQRDVAVVVVVVVVDRRAAKKTEMQREIGANINHDWNYESSM